MEAQPWADWAGASSTFDLLRQAAARTPEEPALLYAESAESFASLLTWRFSELASQVRQAAQLLRSVGVTRGSPVALLCPHMPSAQIALWGAQLAGCAFPINFLLNAEHIAQLLRAAGARVVVALGDTPGLPVAQTTRRALELAGCVDHVLWIDPRESDPADGSFQMRLRAQPDAYAGELPVAFVTLRPGTRVSGEDLLRAIAPSIAEPPAVPRRVVVLDEMPMTPVGKIFKPALRAQAAERKLRELLAAAVPELEPAIATEDRGGRTAARVQLPSDCPADFASRARAAVAELPILVEFV